MDKPKIGKKRVRKDPATTRALREARKAKSKLKRRITWEEIQIQEAMERYEGNYQNLFKRDPEATKFLAKRDYFNFTSLTQISSTYGMSSAVIWRWVNTPDEELNLPSWKELRLTLFEGVLSNMITSKEETCKQILGLGCDNLKRGLLALNARETPMSLGEMQKLATIIGEMNKFIRLEKGESTEIVQTIDASPDGLKKMVDQLAEIDPYVDYSDKDIN